MGDVITKIASVWLALLLPSLVSADYQCLGEVSYEMTKKDAKRAVSVEYASAKSSGPTEESAKQALEKTMREMKLAAREACQQAHENLSGCVGAKFESMASVLQRLPFSSRKSVEEAISQDCTAQMGTCGEVKTRVKCAKQEHEDEKGGPASGGATSGSH